MSHFGTFFGRSRGAGDEMDLTPLLELTPDGVVGVSADGVITVVNPRAEALFGYEAEEMIGAKVESLMPDLFGTSLLGGRTRYLSDPQGRDMGSGLELLGRHKDGTQFPVECASSPHKMNGASIVLLFVRDISARRLAEDAVVRSEHQLSEVIHTSLGAVVGMDAEGIITNWNPQSEVVFGWSRDEVIGKPMTHVIIPERLREAHTEGLRRFLATGTTKMLGTRAETQALHRDGHELEVEVAISAHEMDGTYTFHASITDITERINAKAHLERQIAERTAELAESERRLQAVLDTAVEAIVTIDEEGIVQSANPATVSLFGYEADELLGQNVKMLAASPDREAHDGYISRFIETGEARIIGIGREVEGVRKDGTHFPVELSVSENIVVDGKRRFTGIMRDVTERKRAADALERANDRMEEFVRTSPVPAAVVPLGPGRVAVANDAMAEFLGISMNELLTMDDFTPWADPADRAALMGQLQRDGKLRNIEVQFTRISTGEPRWCQLSATSLMWEDQPAVILGFLDIHDRKLAEEELKATTRALEESEAKLKEAQRMAALGSWEFDLTSKSAWWSDETFELLGFAGGEPPSTEEFVERVVPEDRDGVRRRFSGVVSGASDSEQEYRINHRDKGVRIIQSRIRTVTDEAGNAIKLQGLERDVTEARDAERIVEEARLRAEEANQAKSRFLSSMSHEIRTPMNAILGFSQLLGRDPSLSAEARGRVQLIIESGDHLLSLIDDVLDMSKIEAGGLTLEAGTIDLHELLSLVEGMIRVRAESKGLELESVMHEGLPRYVRTDERKLRQILINVLGNAVKFTESGGIKIRAFPAQSKGERTRLLFEVEDTGEGIAEDEFEQVFAAFEQTATGLQKGTGTGLGMRISRDFARLMGGDLTVVSEVGKGSTFTLEVVVEPGFAGDLAALEDLDRVIGLRADAQAPTVLVVDDKAPNRRLLSELLGAIGIPVVEAEGGEEAVRLCEEIRPDLVFMDVKMPGVGGEEATRRIRDTEAGERMPIVAVSASVFGDERTSMLEAGANKFIQKPFQEERIWEVLEELLDLELVRESAQVDAPSSSADLTPEAMAELGAATLASLKEAVEVGDVDRVMAILDEIEGRHGETVSALRGMVAGFEYDRILSLIAPA